MQIFFITAFVIVFVFLLNGIRTKNKPQQISNLPDDYKIILQQHVAFYRSLTDEQKKKFEGRMAAFLSTVCIQN